MALKTCKKGLHQYDPDDVPVYYRGRCPDCRRATQRDAQRRWNARFPEKKQAKNACRVFVNGEYVRSFSTAAVAQAVNEASKAIRRNVLQQAREHGLDI